ncbi:hypothetical protein HGRIS_010409 [Hohenbuehelia grisea]|uniref:Uncharacterized protein n=1 Tax=Hohenbuehelia grisea TaxID=104357 RepID=A0ABR3J4S9_9AGAR
MTEYDYSPDAYERYIAKQLSIARWVDNTNQHAPANPYTPPTPAQRTRPLQTTHEARPQPIRSKTSPSPLPAHQARSAHSRRSSNARSPTSHRPSASVSHLPDSASSRTQTSSRSHGSRHKPHRSNTAPAYVHQPIYIPQQGRIGTQAIILPPPGGQYVIVPPKGKRLDANPQYYAAQLPHAQPYYPHTAPVTPQSPTKQQPLLKRLFTGLTRSGNKAPPRPKGRSHSRRNSF